MPRAYSAEFRNQVVTAALTEGVTQREIARRFNVSEATVHNWIKKVTQTSSTESNPSAPTEDSTPNVRQRIQELERENLVLRQVAQYLTQGVPPKAMYPLVHELATGLAQAQVPVVVTCRILGFSPQAYYQWRSAPQSRRDRDNHAISEAMRRMKRQQPHAGYRRLNEALRRQGINVSDRRAWRLYSAQELWRQPRSPQSSLPPASSSTRFNESHQAQQSWLVLHDAQEQHARTTQRAPIIAVVIDMTSRRIRGIGVSRASVPAAVAQGLRHASTGDVPGSLALHLTAEHWLEHPHVKGCLDQTQLQVLPPPDAEHNIWQTWSTIREALHTGMRHSKLTRIDLVRDSVRQWVDDIYHNTRNTTHLHGLTPLEYEVLSPHPLRVGA